VIRGGFAAVEPATGRSLPAPFAAATPDEVDAAAARAHEPFVHYAAAPAATRARLLGDLAAALDASADSVVERARSETALPEPQLRAELRRTTQQLRLFAAVVTDGAWRDARIDTADPARQPLAKPDVRSWRVPLGPVAVFGASNFPLAFSVAGGDTASALAAGNPVIVKAHPAHPGTSELVASFAVDAVERAGLPAGTFALLFGAGYEVGRALVGHPLVRAVGFTGSRAGGEALRSLAAMRPEPIPVFAEMSSINPVIVLPGALAEAGPAIADGLHASFTLRTGQLCTNPGVVLVPEGPAGDAFAQRLVTLTRATPAGAMLSANIGAAYEAGLRRLLDHGAILAAAGGEGRGGSSGRAMVWQTTITAVTADRALLGEVFGPSTLLVWYRGDDDLYRFAEVLEGQLTATVHGSPGELHRRGPLLARFAAKVGRLVFNQFPTGVEVGDAMVHGGPFPATSDGRTTSVGTRAIERFTRLIAYQNCPDAILPEELRDANPRGIERLVDGVRTKTPLLRGDRQ